MYIYAYIGSTEYIDFILFSPASTLRKSESKYSGEKKREKERIRSQIRKDEMTLDERERQDFLLLFVTCFDSQVALLRVAALSAFAENRHDERNQ